MANSTSVKDIEREDKIQDYKNRASDRRQLAKESHLHRDFWKDKHEKSTTCFGKMCTKSFAKIYDWLGNQDHRLSTKYTRKARRLERKQ